MPTVIDTLETPSGNTWELRSGADGTEYAVASHRSGKQPVQSFKNAIGGSVASEQMERDESGSFTGKKERGGGGIFPPERRYRSTMIVDYDTSGEYGRETNIQAEAWLQTDEPHTESDARDVWRSVINAAYDMISSELRIDPKMVFSEGPNAEIHPEESRPEDRAGYVTLKGRTYKVDLSDETLSFHKEGDGVL